jgi:hypothetical protein
MNIAVVNEIFRIIGICVVTGVSIGILFILAIALWTFLVRYTWHYILEKRHLKNIDTETLSLLHKEIVKEYELRLNNPDRR